MRLSCSRYIGQPRRLSRFLRAIHLHALLHQHLPISPLSRLLFSSSPPARLFKKRFHYRDRTWPNVATPAIFPAVTSLYLMYVLVSAGHFYRRVSTTHSRDVRLTFSAIRLSTYIKFHFTPERALYFMNTDSLINFTFDIYRFIRVSATYLNLYH